jgi:hypothetical protein
LLQNGSFSKGRKNAGGGSRVFEGENSVGNSAASFVLAGTMQSLASDFAARFRTHDG